jgi:hypothetical protein
MSAVTHQHMELNSKIDKRDPDERECVEVNLIDSE